MKNSLVLKRIEEKPVRLFRELWKYYGEANLFSEFEDKMKHIISSTYTLNDFNIIFRIAYLMKDLGPYDPHSLYDRYKDRIQKYFAKKWELESKEWLANDKRNPRQLFKEAVLRGFIPGGLINMKKGYWYVQFHIGPLSYPKHFKTQASALKLRDEIGIIRWTGVKQF